MGIKSIKGTTENLPCNNRGICDTTLGACKCFTGWSSSDGEGRPGMLGDCGYRNDELYANWFIPLKENFLLASPIDYIWTTMQQYLFVHLFLLLLCLCCVYLSINSSPLSLMPSSHGRGLFWSYFHSRLLGLFWSYFHRRLLEPFMSCYNSYPVAVAV